MRRALPILVLTLLPTTSWTGEPRVKAEDVLGRHGAAIGRPTVPAAHARIIKGPVNMTAPSGGGAGSLTGVFAFSSEGRRFRLKMQFTSQYYLGEEFAFQDEKAEVGFPQPGYRSAIGNFLRLNDVILREGLLGGVLNTGWPLLAGAERGHRVTYDGLKNYEGRALHRLSYRAKKGQGELDVLLYFDPDTFRHVASVYRLSQAQAMGTAIAGPRSDPGQGTSSRESDVYMRLDETFGDFRQWNGLAIPKAWSLRYETQGRVTQHWKYDLSVESIE
jgi:hypothetical protein